MRAVLVSFLLAAALVLLLPSNTLACGPTPVGPNTPTGIAGCERWGEGIASHYGPGDGVAMNFCTWERRHAQGCGYVRVRSNDTGRTVRVPVVDYCDCYAGTTSERIVDLQWGVVAALGLDRSRGLYPVVVEPANQAPVVVLPDTAMGE